MQDLLIFPYSGSALEALDFLGERWRCTGFISYDPMLVGQEAYGIPIWGRDAFSTFPGASVLCVHGSPASYLKRAAIFESLRIDASRLATVIHPKAVISPLAQIGINVLIMAGVVVTANAVIGDHTVILPNSVVHHDSVIGAYTLVAANVTIAGNVRIGPNCYLGASSSLKNGITLPAESLVGIGANVIQSFPEPCVLVGNPAKPLQHHDRR